ncbi:MAG: LacI family DNA-binding transcriptional regulator [Anaerotruncus massiliensis (ex Togo et al. 2019)]
MNIREIARQAGLSIATISRVINHPETVAPETRERVLGILESCNYSPKLAAKPPRKKTGAVVLIVPVLPRYYGILAGIRQVLQANGYQLTICETSGFRGGRTEASARSRPPAGRRDLVRGSKPRRSSGRSGRRGFPSSGREVRGRGGENSCSINFRDAAAKLTAHLIDMKYTRIALVQTEADYRKTADPAGFCKRSRRAAGRGRLSHFGDGGQRPGRVHRFKGDARGGGSPAAGVFCRR